MKFPPIKHPTGIATSNKINRTVSYILLLVGVLVVASCTRSNVAEPAPSSVPIESSYSTDQSLIEASSTCPDRKTMYVEHYTCLGETLLDTLSTNGPDAAFRSMHLLLKEDPIAATACHQAAHFAGRSVTDFENIKNIILFEDGTCDFGIIHGMIEGLVRTPTDKEFYDQLASVCTVAKPGIIRYNCAHGIGHALAIRTEGDIKQLMITCSNLQEEDQEGCTTAAAMAYTTEEASLSDDVVIDMPRLSDDELSDLCKSAKSAAAPICWQMISGMYEGDESSFQSWAASACSKAATVGSGDRCANGYGQALYFREGSSGDLSPDNMERVFDIATDKCALPGLEVECVVGASGAAASFWSAERDSFDNYPNLCDKYKEPIKSACLVPEQQWRDNLASLNKGD